jgi:hypothetical protein
MAHRDGAQGAAETVADPVTADPVVPMPADGSLGDGKGVDGPRDGVGRPAPAADDAMPAEAADDATPGHEVADAGQAEPAPTAPEVGRRTGRFPRPSGPRTPAIGLALSAIRGHRAPATAGTTADLRRSLADTEAQTNELREALDELRQALDAAPALAATTTAVAPPDRRPRQGVLLALLMAGLVAVLVVLVSTRGSAPAASPAPSTSAPAGLSPTTASTSPVAETTGPTASPSTSPGTSPGSSAGPALTTAPLPWPGGAVLVPPGALTTGPGVDAPGTDVQVAVDADRSHLDVFERAVLSAPVDAVTVSQPPQTVWTGGLAGARPTIEGLQIEIDGVAARVQQRGDGWFALPPQGGRATTVVLRYRVANAVYQLPNPPSPLRRMLTLPTLTGLISLQDALPVTVRITDKRVRDISCLSAAKGSLLCRRQAGDTAVATLPADGNPVVIIQADIAKA